MSLHIVLSTQIMKKDHGRKIMMAQLVQESSKQKLKYIYDDFRRKRYNLPVRERPEEGFRHCRTKLAQPMDGEISARYVCNPCLVKEIDNSQHCEKQKSRPLLKTDLESLLYCSFSSVLLLPSPACLLSVFNFAQSVVRILNKSLSKIHLCQKNIAVFLGV